MPSAKEIVYIMGFSFIGKFKFQFIVLLYALLALPEGELARRQP